MEFNKAYNRQEFMSFLQNSFLPEDFKPTIEAVTFSTQMKYTSEATKLGTSDTLDLVVYEIKHTSHHDARVALSKEAFRMLADEMQDRALVVFVPEDNCDKYRFSFIEITLDITEGTNRITRNYSNPRRYSYVLGKGIAYYTPNKYLNEKGRVINDEDLHSRFSVEVLTKEFYNELSDWYAWAINIIRFPNNINDHTDDAKYNNESAIRLITRLIFVWFLKQRHLIPDEFFDESFVANNLLEGFTPHAVSDLFGKSYDSKYYKAILQNLFFAMLNSPITVEGGTELSERHFRNGRGDYDNNKLMRYEDYFSNPQLFVELANKTVPFLNGGLFDCLDDKDNGMYYDGFSDRESVRSKLAVPDFLFFGDEVGKNIDLSEWYGDKNKKKVSARGIIDILKRYNFTVEENTPFDQEVSLDPELLGKVFENLLASYNPETQTTARKQTGSFYTPREIVQYMVDESLVAHLKRTVGEELEPKFRELLQYTDDPIDFTDDQRKSIMESLYNCKILDPTCGSGAFPMGVLQQMVHILRRIDPDNVQWKEMMMNQAIDETTEAYKNATKEERQEQIADIERSFDEGVNRPDYARKLYLIENCIYGVDIQPIAIQISKLRFFISLVVDQKTNADPTDNFGIRPLPNLEAKFVAANTLIGINSDLSLADQAESVRALKQQLKTAKHKIFSAKTIRTKRKYKQQVNDLRIAISSELESLGFITETETSQLASWDMFDQNASSSFFDPDWMFGVKGFDIVIGNPPYIEFKKLKQKIKDSIKSYEVTKGKYDLFVAFIEKSNNLLDKNGIHIFINPTTFMKRDYGKALRSFIKINFKIEKIIDFCDAQMFESATTYTGIFVFQKAKASGVYQFKIHKFKSGVVGKNINTNIFCDCNTFFKSVFDTDSKELDADEWNFVQSTDKSIIDKLYKTSPFRLKDITKYIFVGIQSGKDEVFFVKESQITNYSLERELIHPILKGKDISSYHYKWGGTYIIYPYDENNNVIEESSLKKNYPNIYRYLLSCKDKLAGRDYFDKSPKEWYELWCERNIAKFHQKKIVNAEISPSNRFALDTNNFLGNTKIFSTVLKPGYENYYLAILALLNSKLMNYVHRNISTPKAGGSYEYKTQFIEKYPIVLPDDLESYNKLVTDFINKNHKDALKTIDIKVYHLYDLTYKDILIVDPQTTITEDEYKRHE
jgi:adenine-specific DNA-methyltransferase